MSIVERAVEKAEARRDKRKSKGTDVISQKLVSVSEQATGTPPPSEATLRQHRVVAGLSQNEDAEPYRQLRTQILKLMEDNRWKTLSITSPNEGAGKTLTAANLAIAISRVGTHDVVLIDLDLKSPSVHDLFGQVVEQGLVDCLYGRVGLDDVLIGSGYQNLDLLPGLASESSASEILASPAMKELKQRLIDRYPAPILIFDLPPVLRNDDALQFSSGVDAALMVVEDGVTTEDQLRRSYQLLKNANIVGAILNKARHAD